VDRRQSAADMTVRGTDVYREIDGKWLIAQQGFSA
jgi:hypothetical protein